MMGFEDCGGRHAKTVEQHATGSCAIGCRLILLVGLNHAVFGLNNPLVVERCFRMFRMFGFAWGFNQPLLVGLTPPALA